MSLRERAKNPLLLQGVRVVELSQFVPGPYATLLLADLGADVVKVEPPMGDPQRTDGPIDKDGLAAWYKLVNRNKEIVVIDLKTEQGKSEFDNLLRNADVLMESYRPGVLSRLSYDSARLAELNPGLVHCALSGWGQTGPLRSKAGHDINYQALAGVLDSTGTRDRPVIATPPIADYAGAMFSFGLICAALHSRNATGRGCYIDVAMADAALALMGTELTAAAFSGFDPRRGLGPYTGGAANYNVYQTADGGHITVGAAEAKFWQKFCTLVGKPEWIARQNDPLPQEGLIGEVAALMATKHGDSWIDLLGEHDVCVEKVLRLDEVHEAPQVQDRRVLQVSEDKLSDTLMPAWIDDAPPPPRRPLTETTAELVWHRWNSNERGIRR